MAISETKNRIELTMNIVNMKVTTMLSIVADKYQQVNQA